MMLSLKKKVDPKRPHSRKQRIPSSSHLHDDVSSTSVPPSNTLSMNDARIVSTGSLQETKGYVESDQNVYTNVDNAFSTFNITFDKLKSPNAEERESTANELETALVTISRELSVEQFQRFSNVLHNKIFELIHGSTSEEKIGGILAVNVLISFYSHTEELPNQISRLANYLRTLIPSNDIDVMRQAANAFGRLAVSGNSLASDFVEVEVRTSLEGLTCAPENNPNVKQEYRLHAALLVLISLADNATFLLYPYVDSILNNIWRALRDNKLIIRIDASTVVEKSLKVLKERNIDKSLEDWIKRLYSGCVEGLAMGSTEYIHATLLVYKELLKSGNNPFLKSKVDDIFKNCMAFKNHKGEMIRLEVYRILPLLATANYQRFIGYYLDLVMSHYLNTLKGMNINSFQSSDKAHIYVSIGEIAAQVGPHIESYTKQILEHIRDAFRSKYRVRKYYEKELFFCIGKLGTALGPALSKYLNKDLLGLLLSCTLSDYMEQTLNMLIDKIPALETTINKRILTLLSLYLSGDRFNPNEIQVSSKLTVLDKAQYWRNKNIFNKNDEPKDQAKDSQIVAQALKMINSVNYDGSLVDFARVVIICYCEHENPVVRKLAVLATCNMFARDSNCNMLPTDISRAMAEVLNKILIIALTDPVSDIRQETLKHLTPIFDSQLAQPDNLRIIFSIRNDEVFNIQKECIKLLGRLSLTNPAYIVPLLRKTLLEIVTELKYATWSRKKEECLVLMQLLNSFNKDISKPYLNSILELLFENTKDSSSTVACNSLEVIGELTLVVGKDIKPYLAKLMRLIIDTLKDQSNSYKREVGIKVLGRLATSSNYVIDPFVDYPELLGILLNMLGTESSSEMRKQTIKILGILGALDPYKHREVEITSTSSKGRLNQTNSNIDISLLMSGMLPSNENYYPTVVITILTKILKDPVYSPHHTVVIQNIMHIVHSIGSRSTALIEKIIPATLSAMKISPPSVLEFYFQQIGILIPIVKEYISPFVDDIFDVIEHFFPISNLHHTIIFVIESISKAITNSFKSYMPRTLTLLLKSLENDKSSSKKVSIRILKSLIVLSPNLENYSHMILPTVIRMSEFASDNLRKKAIVTIGKLAKSINLSEMSSRIILSLLRTIHSADKETNKATMNTICLLLLQMNSDFIVYVPIINKTLLTNKVQHSVYDQLANKLLNNEPLPTSIIFDKENIDNNNDTSDKYTEIQKLPINEDNLKNTWGCTHLSSRESWQEWFKRFSIQLLKESPSPSLRACSNLVNVSYPLAKELLNVSFASCWNELSHNNQESLLNAICTALSSTKSPPEVHQSLLSLVEYMEHEGNPLPISIKKLGEYAQKCNSYAKALYYKELEFKQDTNPAIIESLININNQLHQADAAIGVLKYAQNNHNLQLKETWFEKLQKWEDALESYNERQKSGEDSTEITLGKMRSLFALGRWEDLAELADSKWKVVRPDVQKSMASLAAGAAWMIGHWDIIEKYINVLPPHTQYREFFDAILCVHRNNFTKADRHISSYRSLLVNEISSLVNESYSRAYSVIVKAEMITELEETIVLKKLPYLSDERSQIKQMWNKRLFGVQRNVDTWRNILQIRSLVLKRKDDLDIWIEFANIARKDGRMELAKKLLDSLLYTDTESSQYQKVKAPPPVIYAQLKYLWDVGSQKVALTRLVDFTARVVQDLGLDPKNMIVQDTPMNCNLSPEHVAEYTELVSHCFIKQGEWMVTLEPGWRTKNPDTILSSYLLATHFNSSSYKAWHKWALANFEVISTMLLDNRESSMGKNAVFDMRNGTAGLHTLNTESNGFDDRIVHRHVVPAINGFFHSIALSESSSLQDALRLLTLWFTFGGIPEATQAMNEGFNITEIGTWLEVLPQLISRIHQPNVVVSRALVSLLSDMGKTHPQALVYPLTVAIKSESISRRKAAQSIIDKMKLHCPNLVEQAELVSQELIRIAVLWHEQWYEGLEEASRQFFGEHNIEKMLAILEPLHDLLQNGPETLREISFQNSFGRDLHYAKEWVEKYKEDKDVSNINQAWDFYYNVFRKISKLLPQLQTLELQHVGPKLLTVKNFELVIPGTYEIDKPLITISEFEPKLSVIASKQRPRKVTIKGSDGKDYQYCLKGHEDIRQDSLVMQLFGLVNTLLQNDTESFKRHLDIQQFAAIPLSPKAGLLGWVSNSDTFHMLIKDHRESTKVPLNIEHWVMLQMAPDYDTLTLLEKIEVFQYSMENSKGDDLAQVLWLKSRSSESWLERRTTYTRSLAVMSMVGYILGLGDRHPSNLLLDRSTGKVVHIDFGDCFESTILREKFPEKVPFRLTRMLRNAMEVSGIEGSFRITCEHVMRVLRDNKESLVAILEAFAFDPLIFWGFDLPREKIMEQTGIDLTCINTNDLLMRGEITAEEANDIEQEQEQKLRNARAMLVLKRVDDKLTGNDIGTFSELNVPDQVDKLIQQAISIENLCQHYIGWCPFW